MIIHDAFGGLMIKKDLLRRLLDRNRSLSDSLSYLLDVPHTGEYVSLEKVSDLMKGVLGRGDTSKTLYCLTCNADELPDLILSDDRLESDIARARLGMPSAKKPSYSEVLSTSFQDVPDRDEFSMSSFLGIDPMNTQKIPARRASRLAANGGRTLV